MKNRRTSSVKNSIKYEQIFHPIGQGLFYSNSLNLNEGIAANVIFDCGSNNLELIKREIKKFNCTDIDVLIISHLHYDHISGLEYLLQNRKVNTVVLPYLLLNERILLQLFNMNRPQWYNEFLSNPYLYLSAKKNIENVIIINGTDPENDYSENLPKEFPTLNGNLIDINRNIHIRLEDVDDKTKENIENNENIKFGKKLSLKKDIGYIQISKHLFLYFFNYKINNDKKVKAFYDEINNLKISNTESARIVFSDPNKRKELVDSYKKIKKDLNITSLAAYQSLIMSFDNKPIHHKYLIYIQPNSPCQIDFVNNLLCCNCGCRLSQLISRSTNKFYFYCSAKNQCNIKIGTLLLGDIKLNYKSKKRKEMFVHFKELLPFVKLVQLSHHGAENGWHKNLIKKIPSNSLYVASFGTDNTYHHPHKKVIMELIEKNRKFVTATENNGVLLQVEMGF